MPTTSCCLAPVSFWYTDEDRSQTPVRFGLLVGALVTKVKEGRRVRVDGSTQCSLESARSGLCHGMAFCSTEPYGKIPFVGALSGTTGQGSERKAAQFLPKRHEGQPRDTQRATANSCETDLDVHGIELFCCVLGQCRCQSAWTTGATSCS